jgi:hypothetical protein
MRMAAGALGVRSDAREDDDNAGEVVGGRAEDLLTLGARLLHQRLGARLVGALRLQVNEAHL